MLILQRVDEQLNYMKWKRREWVCLSREDSMRYARPYVFHGSFK
jgi:hypothetical protein